MMSDFGLPSDFSFTSDLGLTFDFGWMSDLGLTSDPGFAPGGVIVVGADCDFTEDAGLVAAEGADLVAAGGAGLAGADFAAGGGGTWFGFSLVGGFALGLSLSTRSARFAKNAATSRSPDPMTAASGPGSPTADGPSTLELAAAETTGMLPDEPGPGRSDRGDETMVLAPANTGFIALHSAPPFWTSHSCRAWAFSRAV